MNRRSAIRAALCLPLMPLLASAVDAKWDSSWSEIPKIRSRGFITHFPPGTVIDLRDSVLTDRDGNRIA